MTPQATPRTTDRPAAAPDGRRRVRSVVVALLAAALAAATWTALPVDDAAAAGSRTVSVSLSCTDTSPTVGTPFSCTVQVEDTASGTRSVPTGSVGFSVSSPSSRTGTVVPLDGCTLVANSSRRSGCTVAFLATAASERDDDGDVVSTVLRADFTPDGPSPHAAGSRTRNLSVSGISTPVLYSPNVAGTSGSGARSDTKRLWVPGCTSGTGSVFVANSTDSNPATSTYTIKGWERQADAFGTFTFAGTPGADHPIGTFRVRFTCSTGSAGSLTASNVTWTSPVFSYTITLTGSLRAAVDGGTDGGGSGAGTGTPGAFVPSEGPTDPVPGQGVPVLPAVTMTVDPESLPLVDQFGIPGPQAAALKAQVDALRADAGTVGRLAWAALGRMPARSVYDRWVPQVASRGTWGLERELERTPEFVGWFGLATDDVFLERAYSRTLGRWPTATERSDALRRLRSQGVPRVRILAELVGTAQHRDRVAVRDDVVAAYLALTPVVPSAADLARFEAMTRAVLIRVQVIEEIALTRAPASRWIAALAVPGARPRF